MRRPRFVLQRNDVRPEGFRRWTGYDGNTSVLDIEVTECGEKEQAPRVTVVVYSSAVNVVYREER